MSNSLARNQRPGTTAPGATRQQLDELDALLQRMLDLPVNQAEEPEEPEPVPISRPAPRAVREIPAPEPNLPPVRYYEPDMEPEEDDDSPPPGYPPTQTLVGATTYSPRPEPRRPDAFSPRIMADETPIEPPVPGGRHNLEEDQPVDPTEELARIRAKMQESASLPPTANIPNPPQLEAGDWVPLRSSWQPSAQTWKPLAERWEQVAPAPMPPRNSPAGPVITTQPTAELAIPDPPPVTRQQPTPPAEQPTAPAPAPAPAKTRRRSWALLPLVWFNVIFDVMLMPWCPKGKMLRGPAGRYMLGVLGILCLLGAAALVAAEWFGWIW